MADYDFITQLLDETTGVSPDMAAMLAEWRAARADLDRDDSPTTLATLARIEARIAEFRPQAEGDTRALLLLAIDPDVTDAGPLLWAGLSDLGRRGDIEWPPAWATPVAAAA